ncbi:ABC transporter ATP-binding protein [Paracoccus shandongensis]|uniref:ABC transporter ATP-binding protein n=1 Tax=Paracoccus shandongensis TaxID=2816048 RepID=UPI001A8E7697|nr:ABC transporter ATP-binding protein [Paracoccus shandongensis]
MIKLENLTKIYRLNGRKKVIADNITAVFPTGEAVALLGRNGAGKSSLLRMMAGSMLPTSGRILSTGRISWPVGFAGAFHKELSGEQNVRFLARVYGLDTDAVSDFVQNFAGLGQHYYLPFRTYSSGMRSRLAFGASMAVPFDTYLIDEVTAVGDASFRKKSTELLKQRLCTSSAIVVSHSLGTLKRICQSGAVLENGKLYYYNDIDDAIAHHSANMEAAES